MLKQLDISRQERGEEEVEELKKEEGEEEERAHVRGAARSLLPGEFL